MIQSPSQFSKFRMLSDGTGKNSRSQIGKLQKNRKHLSCWSLWAHMFVHNKFRDPSSSDLAETSDWDGTGWEGSIASSTRYVSYSLLVLGSRFRRYKLSDSFQMSVCFFCIHTAGILSKQQIERICSFLKVAEEHFTVA